MTRIIMWLLFIGGLMQVAIAVSYLTASAFVAPDETDVMNQRIMEQLAHDELAANAPDSQAHAEAVLRLDLSKRLANEIDLDVRIRRGGHQFIGITWLAPGIVFLIAAGLYYGQLEIRDRLDTFMLHQRMAAP